MRRLSFLFVSLIFLCFLFPLYAQIDPAYDLRFATLADSWDEAVPLGNGMLGNLVWQKNGRLRFSLDRADLWDLRPMKNIDFSKWTFRDVYHHWQRDDYAEVQKVFDVPYDTLAAPSKIPAGALEFDISALGPVRSVRLELDSALCLVEWENGARLTTFIHGAEPVGWFRFENVPPNRVAVELVPPAYNQQGDRRQVDQSRSDLDQLGYPAGTISNDGSSWSYEQQGWNTFSYRIFTRWDQEDYRLTGCWSISAHDGNGTGGRSAAEVVQHARSTGFERSLAGHVAWWKSFWAQSGVTIPDSLLQKQYLLEMYKFGAAARSDAPPIALQAVWTADNGKLPPWKGDFHHDLNTQLSYWPAYAGNQLDLEQGFLNWLWSHRQTFRKYTRDYFGVEGLNVPGVTTLAGEPMGGWIQYSMGQTVSAWLGHHFYLHWRFSMDRHFLESRAYPWIRETALFLDNISVKSPDGRRKLLMSSSPEINNNSREAWFAETTNFDLALIRWTFAKAAELADELGRAQEADDWRRILAQWPDLAVDPGSGLEIAPNYPYIESHRHFSHLMAIHPLGLVDFSMGQKERGIITKSLNNLERQGTDYWTGYSFSWAANLYARACRGDKAAEMLRIFARCFCLKNSFHVNGDQCRAGYSKFTYRPFTLEGNFAFAAAVQEMLIQSHTGVIKLFPAIPPAWQQVAFEKLRAQGAFLVSARLEEGAVESVEILSEKGGLMALENPFADKPFRSSLPCRQEGGRILRKMAPGETLVLDALN